MAQIALSISFFLSVILAILSQMKSRRRDDLRAVQACHANPTSRLGGLAVALGLIVAWLVFPDGAYPMRPACFCCGLGRGCGLACRPNLALGGIGLQ